MGYPTISEFDREFIRRTRENLDCKVQNVYTHLMNSLLGLLVLPKQWHAQGKHSADFFSEMLSEQSFFDFLKTDVTISDEFQTQVTIKKIESPHLPYEKMTVGYLIEMLRNSIAHQSLRPTSEGGAWRGIVFRNYSKDSQSGKWEANYNLQVYMSMSEIKDFAIYITDQYLKDA